MSREIIDHGFGVIETRETFYTEETIRQKDEKIAELQKQLEDAEEHIDSLELQLREQYQIVDEKDEQLAEKEKDKISFAVEQLEKVKCKIQHNILFADCEDYLNVIEEIDDQIKQLTH